MLKKGSLIYLEGKLTTRKWQDKDGNDKYTTEIVARTYRSMERRENAMNEGTSIGSLSGGENDFPTVEKSVSTPASPPQDDDLPF